MPVTTIKSQKPLNVGAPITPMRRYFVAPSEQFFIRCPSNIPTLDLPSYRLILDEMLNLPMSLTMDELQAIKLISGEVHWDSDAISTSNWKRCAWQTFVLDEGKTWQQVELLPPRLQAGVGRP